MPKIDYRPSGFPSTSPAWLLARGTLDATWQDLVWAAVSVGKSGLLDLFQHGPFSLDELMFRVYMVYANLQETSGRLARSPAYDTLDPSEKGAVSFFFGMTFAKLAAQLTLDTPWLVHLSKMQQINLVGRSRPDLIGRTVSGDWIVIEAKGRTGQFSRRAMRIAKGQVQQVRAIGGVAPQYRVAAQAFFSSHLELAMEDPAEDDSAVDLELTEDDLLATYYEPFRRISIDGVQREVEGESYDFVRFENLDASIGINHRLSSNPQGAARNLQLSAAENGRRIGASLVVYPDGLAVELGETWSPEAMNKAPGDRQ